MTAQWHMKWVVEEVFLMSLLALGAIPLVKDQKYSNQ